MYAKSLIIVALALTSSISAMAAESTPPAVPDILQVEQGSKAFAIG